MGSVRAVAVWVLAGSALWAASAAPAMANPDLTQATETLRLSIAEWKREDAAYREARSAAKIPRAEQEAYAGYVAGLRLRVLEQCEVVRGLGGEASVAPFECVRTGPEEQRSGAVVPPAQVLTDEEKKAAVQARLNELEGDIDESLQKRQQEIRQTAAAASRSSRGGGAGSGSAGGSGGAGRDGGGSTAANTSTGSWSDPDAKKRAGEATTGEEKGGTGSDGSPVAGSSPRPAGAAGPTDRQAAGRQRPTDGSVDDDIVARQLREAAEKETDPVLKEKLWAEYRKYKEAKK